MITLNAVLAAVAVERQGANGTIIFFVQMVLIFLIFYWLMIRPQAKERRRLQDRIEELKKGDEIITSGGIVGDVVKVQDGRVTLRSGESQLIVDKGRIAHVLTPEASG